MMGTIFKPVFESIWKRKETKIYLAFALLYPALLLFASFLPEESNFLKPGVTDSLFTYNVAFAIILSFVYDLVVPVLALFYLTFTVFRGEADSHTMYLYKDIKRKDIFWAKLTSLFVLVLIFLGIFTLTLLAVYYGRLIQIPDIYSTKLMDDTDPLSFSNFVYTLSGFIFDSILCILIAACASLYSGVGLTMVLAFTYSLGTTLLNVFGFIYLTPTGLSDKLWEGMSLWTALGHSGLVTFLYASILTFFTLNYFKQMEY
ncbi:hypothetical protein ACVRYP_08560 [Streptococcus rifensis]